MLGVGKRFLAGGFLGVGGSLVVGVFGSVVGVSGVWVFW